MGLFKRIKTLEKTIKALTDYMGVEVKEVDEFTVKKTKKDLIGFTTRGKEE